jgi:hypothetical protein
MTPFPLPLDTLFGHFGALMVYFVIGFGFGGVLEMAGFGNSTKLAAQFYFKDLTVLKVMFGAIIVAMALIFLATGMGILDYNLVWVNTTYLIPGIVGGLIMGVGFIIGGFCPGTSLVAAVTGKLDGIFFVVGALFGIFLFGETVEGYDVWWNSTNMGRVTLMDTFQLDTGVIVVGVILMALMAFFAAEQAERYFGKRDLGAEPKWRYGAALGVLALGVVVLFIGQPTTAAKYERMAATRDAQLANREVQIDPLELLTLLHDPKVNIQMLDVRSEGDFNRFHLLDAQHVPPEQIPAVLADLHAAPFNTVFVVMSNDETAATAVWQTLVAENLPNVYILGGGINQWLATFGDETFLAEHALLPNAADDTLRYAFPLALGARLAPANPNYDLFKGMAFTPKVKLSGPRGAKTGGCG